MSGYELYDKIRLYKTKRLERCIGWETELLQLADNTEATEEL